MMKKSWALVGADDCCLELVSLCPPVLVVWYGMVWLKQLQCWATHHATSLYSTGLAAEGASAAGKRQGQASLVR